MKTTHHLPHSRHRQWTQEASKLHTFYSLAGISEQINLYNSLVMLRSSILSPRSSPSGRLPIINEGYSRRKSKVPTAKSRAELLNHALAELERVRRISTNTGHFLVGGGPQQAHLRKKRYQPCDTDFESQIHFDYPPLGQPAVYMQIRAGLP